MRFTLTYDGELPPRGTAADKQAIREWIHPQLKDLWTHDAMRQVTKYRTELNDPSNPEQISVLHETDGCMFAALIGDRLGLRAELDILMLRAERPGGIVTAGGDIDNGLKTLLDALATPLRTQDLAPVSFATSIEEPFFTLLEDDKFITRLSIETDRLLNPVDQNHVRLTIKVDMRASRLMNANMGLLIG